MPDRGRPAHRRQQVLQIIDAAAVLGQVPTYRGMARDLGMDRTDVKRICRALNWPAHSPA